MFHWNSHYSRSYCKKKLKIEKSWMLTFGVLKLCVCFSLLVIISPFRISKNPESPRLAASNNPVWWSKAIKQQVDEPIIDRFCWRFKLSSFLYDRSSRLKGSSDLRFAEIQFLKFSKIFFKIFKYSKNF